MSKLDRAALIGRGFCADVYSWGEGRVLKLFQGTTDQAEREFAATCAVHSAGLPAPEAFEVVEVEGRPGIVFERIEGVSLFEQTQARPWKLFSVIRLAAELHAEIHGFTAPAGLPTLHERIIARIESAKGTVLEKRAALDRLATLPQGASLCHGDFHPGNVLMSPRGPVVIDWSSASRGHPIGDLACTSRLMRSARLPPWAAWYSHLMLRGLRSGMHRSYLNWYFRRRPGSRREIEAWRMPLQTAAEALPP